MQSKIKKKKKKIQGSLCTEKILTLTPLVHKTKFIFFVLILKKNDLSTKNGFCVNF